MKSLPVIIAMLSLCTIVYCQANVYEIRSPQYPAGDSIRLIWRSSTDSTAVARDMATWYRGEFHQRVLAERNLLYQHVIEWYKRTMQLVDPALFASLAKPPPPEKPAADAKNVKKHR